jgi:hypothetical protein
MAMMERPVERDEAFLDGVMEERELAAFFRELGLGWEYDPEGLIERLSAAEARR